MDSFKPQRPRRFRKGATNPDHLRRTGSSAKDGGFSPRRHRDTEFFQGTSRLELRWGTHDNFGGEGGGESAGCGRESSRWKGASGGRKCGWGEGSSSWRGSCSSESGCAECQRGACGSGERDSCGETEGADFGAGEAEGAGARVGIVTRSASSGGTGLAASWTSTSGAGEPSGWAFNLGSSEYCGCASGSRFAIA